MEVFTKEIAHALGVRDRINGHDAEDRHITLDRFRSRYGRPLKRLRRAYLDGYYEADIYVRSVMGKPRREVVIMCPRVARRLLPRAPLQLKPPSEQ